MKYEAFKLEIARMVRHKILTCAYPEINFAIINDLVKSNFEVRKTLKNKHHSAEVEVYADKAFDVIMAWDIRAVNRLRDLFIDCVPKKFKTSKLSIYMADNENSDWMIEAN